MASPAELPHFPVQAAEEAERARLAEAEEKARVAWQHSENTMGGFSTFSHALWIQTLSEKVQKSLQMIVNYTPVTLPFRRYDWIHRDGKPW